MQLDLWQRSSNASPYGNYLYRQPDVVEGRPSAALLSTVQSTNPEEATEVCSREDSAMHLAYERLSNSGARHTAIPVFCQGTDTRTSSSSLKVSTPSYGSQSCVDTAHLRANLHHKFRKHSVSSLLPYCIHAILHQVCADNAMQATRLWLHRVRGPLPQEGAASVGRLSLLPGPMRRACPDSAGEPL